MLSQTGSDATTVHVRGLNLSDNATREQAVVKKQTEPKGRHRYAEHDNKQKDFHGTESKDFHLLIQQKLHL